MAKEPIKLKVKTRTKEFRPNKIVEASIAEPNKKNAKELDKGVFALELKRAYPNNLDLAKLYFGLATTPGLIEKQEAFANTIQDPVKRTDILAILRTAKEYRNKLNN